MEMPGLQETFQIRTGALRVEYARRDLRFALCGTGMVAMILASSREVATQIDRERTMMTNADFAMYAMRIASRAANWAGDCMILPDSRNEPMHREAADRFIKSQLELLDWIERETRS